LLFLTSAGLLLLQAEEKVKATIEIAMRILFFINLLC